jgi:hypothetical protein
MVSTTAPSEAETTLSTTLATAATAKIAHNMTLSIQNKCNSKYT